MKKTLILLTSLIAISGATCPADWRTQLDTDNKSVTHCVQGGKFTVGGNGNYDIAGMPKVRFEFKDGTPV